MEMLNVIWRANWKNDQVHKGPQKDVSEQNTEDPNKHFLEFNFHGAKVFYEPSLVYHTKCIVEEYTAYLFELL